MATSRTARPVAFLLVLFLSSLSPGLARRHASQAEAEAEAVGPAVAASAAARVMSRGAAAAAHRLQANTKDRFTRGSAEALRRAAPAMALGPTWPTDAGASVGVGAGVVAGGGFGDVAHGEGDGGPSAGRAWERQPRWRPGGAAAAWLTSEEMSAEVARRAGAVALNLFAEIDPSGDLGHQLHMLLKDVDTTASEHMKAPEQSGDVSTDKRLREIHAALSVLDAMRARWGEAAPGHFQKALVDLQLALLAASWDDDLRFLAMDVIVELQAATTSEETAQTPPSSHGEALRKVKAALHTLEELAVLPLDEEERVGAKSGRREHEDPAWGLGVPNMPPEVARSRFEKASEPLRELRHIIASTAAEGVSPEWLDDLQDGAYIASTIGGEASYNSFRILESLRRVGAVDAEKSALSIGHLSSNNWDVLLVDAGQAIIDILRQDRLDARRTVDTLEIMFLLSEVRLRVQRAIASGTDSMEFGTAWVNLEVSLIIAARHSRTAEQARKLLEGLCTVAELHASKDANGWPVSEARWAKRLQTAAEILNHRAESHIEREVTRGQRLIMLTRDHLDETLRQHGAYVEQDLWEELSQSFRTVVATPVMLERSLGVIAQLAESAVKERRKGDSDHLSGASWSAKIGQTITALRDLRAEERAVPSPISAGTSAGFGPVSALETSSIAEAASTNPSMVRAATRAASRAASRVGARAKVAGRPFAAAAGTMAGGAGATTAGEEMARASPEARLGGLRALAEERGGHEAFADAAAPHGLASAALSAQDIIGRRSFSTFRRGTGRHGRETAKHALALFDGHRAMTRTEAHILGSVSPEFVGIISEMRAILEALLETQDGMDVAAAQAVKQIAEVAESDGKFGNPLLTRMEWEGKLKQTLEVLVRLSAKASAASRGALASTPPASTPPASQARRAFSTASSVTAEIAAAFDAIADVRKHVLHTSGPEAAAELEKLERAFEMAMNTDGAKSSAKRLAHQLQHLAKRDGKVSWSLSPQAWSEQLEEATETFSYLGGAPVGGKRRRGGFADIGRRAYYSSTPNRESKEGFDAILRYLRAETDNHVNHSEWRAAAIDWATTLRDKAEALTKMTHASPSEGSPPEVKAEGKPEGKAEGKADGVRRHYSSTPSRESKEGMDAILRYLRAETDDHVNHSEWHATAAEFAATMRDNAEAFTNFNGAPPTSQAGGADGVRRHYSNTPRRETKERLQSILRYLRAETDKHVNHSAWRATAAEWSATLRDRAKAIQETLVGGEPAEKEKEAVAAKTTEADAPSADAAKVGPQPAPKGADGKRSFSTWAPASEPAENPEGVSKALGAVDVLRRHVLLSVGTIAAPTLQLFDHAVQIALRHEDSRDQAIKTAVYLKRVAEHDARHDGWKLTAADWIGRLHDEAQVLLDMAMDEDFTEGDIYGLAADTVHAHSAELRDQSHSRRPPADGGAKRGFASGPSLGSWRRAALEQAEEMTKSKDEVRAEWEAKSVERVPPSLEVDGDDHYTKVKSSYHERDAWSLHARMQALAHVKEGDEFEGLTGAGEANHILHEIEDIKIRMDNVLGEDAAREATPSHMWSELTSAFLEAMRHKEAHDPAIEVVMWLNGVSHREEGLADQYPMKPEEWTSTVRSATDRLRHIAEQHQQHGAGHEGKPVE